MDWLLFARVGESRRSPLWVCCGSVALAAGLAACGGGSDGPSNTTKPRNVDRTPRLALAWSSEGAFTGSIVAQIELGLSHAASTFFPLQHNGAPAIYLAPEDDESSSGAPFELRYADGFFLLTAQRDNTVAQANNIPFGVDLYPPGVPRVPPAGIPLCTGNDTETCSNSLGFVAMSDWPSRAGDSATRLIPRADPAMLIYTVLAQRAEGQGFFALLEGARGQSQSMMRDEASFWDFPSARVKVRGCDTPDGTCVESEERSLQSALVRGVVPIDVAAGPAVNAALSLDRAAHRLAFKHQQSSFDPLVLVQQREPEQGRWFNVAAIANATPGFGRTLAFSADGNTLAVEASPCAVTTMVCATSSVFVYAVDSFGTTWSERARFDGVRAPRLDQSGVRLLAIGVGERADTVAAFELRTGWVEVPFPALDYTPLDIALSIKGDTLAVARQGTDANPCGCRAVVVYDFVVDAAPGWRRTAVLHSKKRLDTVGSMNDDGFGFASGTTQSLALSAEGEMIVVGASLDSSDVNDKVGDPNNHNAPQSGALYVFQRQADNTFVQTAFIKAAGAAPLDHFGHTVSLWSERLYAGARGLTANAAGVNRNHVANPALPSPTPGAGGSLNGAAVYAFVERQGAWVEQAKMIAPNADAADFSTYHALGTAAGGTVALATGVRDASGTVSRRIFVY